MDALTPVDLLQSLPVLLYIWSAIVLVWGAAAGTLIYKLSKKTASCRQTVLRHSDKHTLVVVAAVNALLMWYLFQFSTANECTSWIVVVNVFYTVHLVCMSIDITRWWNSLKRCCARQQTV